MAVDNGQANLFAGKTLDEINIDGKYKLSNHSTHLKKMFLRFSWN